MILNKVSSGRVSVFRAWIVLCLGLVLVDCGAAKSMLSGASLNTGGGSNQTVNQCSQTTSDQNLNVNPTSGGASLNAVTGNNVMSLTIDGDQCLSVPATDPSAHTPPNAPCVSVTVCPPGSASSSAPNCQVIHGLLLDTGSVGLRVFRSAMNCGLVAALTPVGVSSGKIAAECVTFADGSAEWGPIAQATVFMGGEGGASTPIQIIDDTFGGAWNGATSGSSVSGPAVCQSLAGAGSSSTETLDQGPAQLGYNGVLGVGLYAQDCGTQCTNPTPYPQYYSCTGNLTSATTCSLQPISLSKVSQVQNPVAQLPQDNNGVVVMLPSVGQTGATFAGGYLVFGVGTQANNTPAGSVKTFLQDPSTGEITASLNGATNPAFLDTGSTYYNFAAGSSTSGLVDCGTLSSIFSGLGFYCPTGSTGSTTNVVSLSSTISGYTGSSASAAVTISVGNPLDLFSAANNNWVFSDIGVGSSLSGFSSSTVDLGLPFYFGRSVYHGFESRSSSLGSGPYWAF